jgi:hypothetical protein|tara:strand:- start:1113 stop:1268 length:156 start_codon:yes stop_codon:yes gene_type:complete
MSILEENAVEKACVMLSFYPSPVMANSDIELKMEGTLCCLAGKSFSYLSAS